MADLRRLSTGGQVMEAEIAKLLNEDGLSSLLEGEDANAIRTCFEDYWCEDTPGDLPYHSDDESLLHTDSENVEETESQEKDYRGESSDDEHNVEALLLSGASMEVTSDSHSDGDDESRPVSTLESSALEFNVTDVSPADSTSQHQSSPLPPADHSDGFDKLSVLPDSFSCGCKRLLKGVPCSRQFPPPHYQYTRDFCNEMSKSELDILLLGQIMAFTDEVTETTTRHSSKKRSKPHSTYLHKGKKICQKTFAYLHGIGKGKVISIRKHLMANGLVVREHKASRKRPWNCLPFNDIKLILKFLVNYAEENAILLPGRVPGHKNSEVQLLPSSTTKMMVWEQYSASCAKAGLRAAARTTFMRYWRELAPHILVMKPMNDLCWVCQKNSTLIMRAKNMPDESKSRAIKVAEKHIQLVSDERNYYKDVCKKSATALKTHFTGPNDEFSPPQPASHIRPLQNDITVHYSFDFAQQVHYPCNPQQPGPMNFLTPRKCGLFGVCCEGIPRQINYLIDEANITGKGANTVISLLHHFFETHGMGESRVHLHADNCSGQNKNRHVIAYFMWRVLTGLHKEITFSFLIVGHTKFSPDTCFGLIKKKLRRTNLGCLQDIAIAVSVSSIVNHSQLVGAQDGTSIVPMYDWGSYLDHYTKKIVGIKKFHHFRFSHQHPGEVFVKTTCYAREKSYNILKDNHNFSSLTLPPVIDPPGLPAERQQYLYNKIREFCPEEVRDEVCPIPSGGLETPCSDSEDESFTPPPPKRTR